MERNNMKLIRNIAVAFSLYSQIPMPIFKWEDDDMKHNLVFLPWIGAVIGGLYFGIVKIFGLVDLPMIAQIAVFSLIPLLIFSGEDRLLLVFAVSFFTSRSLTGITSLVFKHAKKDGMLNMETEKMNRGDLLFLIIELLAGTVLMIYIDWLAGILGIAGMLIFTAYYRHITYNK